MIYQGKKEELFEHDSVTKQVIYCIFNVYNEFRRNSKNQDKAPIEYLLYAPELKKYQIELTREEFEDLIEYAFENFGIESADEIRGDYENGRLQNVKYKT